MNFKGFNAYDVATLNEKQMIVVLAGQLANTQTTMDAMGEEIKQLNKKIDGLIQNEKE